MGDYVKTRTKTSEEDEFLRLGRCKWITRDKQVVLLAEMTEMHLKNTIAMLRRHGNELMCQGSVAFAYAGTFGEFASHYAKQAVDETASQAGIAYRTADLLDRYLHLRKKSASDTPAKSQ